jgi:hypothetical protein
MGSHEQGNTCRRAISNTNPRDKGSGGSARQRIPSSAQAVQDAHWCALRRWRLGGYRTHVSTLVTRAGPLRAVDELTHLMYSTHDVAFKSVRARVMQRSQGSRL